MAERTGSHDMKRRSFLTAALASAALPAAAQQTRPIDFRETARALARVPHRDPAMDLPRPFDALTYDSYRAIRPAPGGAADLTLGPALRADLFPPGFYFQDAVRVEVETDDGFRELPFSPALFSYSDRYFDAAPDLADSEIAQMGFSGARLRSAFRSADRFDEFMAVQGASYFRAASVATVYGLSARALALGTGAQTPEEFPVFTRLRLSRQRGAAARIDALIESPSLTGAATLRTTPGEPTVTEVDVTIFPRKTLANIGIAPLTSMYLKGPLRAAVADDFRPAVHDSDVLKILNGAGETLVRPVTNPANLQSSAFQDMAPRGFGLLQTPRSFADFEDPEAVYHRRPSAWVEPKGDWGKGRVILVEIPTDTEFMDNIVAFWRPELPLDAGGEYSFAYRVLWGRAPAPTGPFELQVAQTRSGKVHDQPGQLQYIVDFTGAVTEPVTLDLTASAGTVTGATAYPIAARGHLRVGFRFAPENADVAELRLVLRGRGGRALSDVWLHRWTPARDGGP